MNDCKYGYDIHQNNIALTLIKSSVRPDETAGRSRPCEFVYAIYPHKGGFRESQVQQRAMEMNFPVLLGFAAPGNPKPSGILCGGDKASLVHTDSDHVVINTVKRAEEEEAVIVRFYEYKNQKDDQVTLIFSRPVKRAVVTNLIERELLEESSAVEGGRVVVPMHGYEIKTLKVYF